MKSELCPWATVYRMTIAHIVGFNCFGPRLAKHSWDFSNGLLFMVLSTTFEIRNEINKQPGTQYGMDATYCSSLFKLRF